MTIKANVPELEVTRLMIQSTGTYRIVTQHDKTGSRVGLVVIR